MHINFSEISQRELETYNKRGWIPGPGEKDADFLKRIEQLNHLYSYPPAQLDHFLLDTDWISANEATKSLFDFEADWIVGYYSDQKLSFFQGAATWIYEKEGYRMPIIQLKEKFSRGSLFKLYRREEVLSHEAVHAARMQFDEPLFEEIFAYKTSPHFWRRYLGPVFQKPWEGHLFIGLLFLPIIGTIWEINSPQYPMLFYLSAFPIIYFSGLVLRLIFLRFTLSLALHRLKHFLTIPEKKWAFALRLNDREIFRFAYQSEKKIKSYLEEQTSLRWRLLARSYLKKI